MTSFRSRFRGRKVGLAVVTTILLVVAIPILALLFDATGANSITNVNGVLF